MATFFQVVGMLTIGGICAFLILYGAGVSRNGDKRKEKK
jgi:hypothetical protein